MPTKVEFEFNLEEKVITKFGDEGFIEMLGYEDSIPKYHVKWKANDDGRWFRADEIKRVKVKKPLKMKAANK